MLWVLELFTWYHWPAVFFAVEYLYFIVIGGLSEKQPFIPELLKESESIDSIPVSRDPFARTYQVRNLDC